MKQNAASGYSDEERESVRKGRTTAHGETVLTDQQESMNFYCNAKNIPT